MLFDKHHILLDQKFKNKKELFEHLAFLAKQKGISRNSEIVKNGFSKRESEGTTGFEDGFAIPHSRVSGIEKPSLFIIRNEKKFEGWDSLDSNGVKYAIALMISEKAGSLHMEVLSTIATKLMDESFRNIIKNGSQNDIFSSFSSLLSKINNKNNFNQNKIKKIDDSKELVVGISACPAGIAHTYMAKQKMENAAKELGMNVKWETQGASGKKNNLTKQDIDKASVIIIASDIDIDLKRFLGKKILVTNTNDAIKNGSNLIKRAKTDSKEYNGDSILSKNPFMNFARLMKKSFQSSFGKPWIYLSITGSLLAIIALTGYSWYGQTWTNEAKNLNKELFQIQEIAKFALYLSMPFMAASIAKKVVNRNEVFAIVFIAALLLNIPSITTGWNSITGENQYQLNLFYNWNGFFDRKYLDHGSNILGAFVSTFAVVLIFKTINNFINFLDKNKQNQLAKIIRNGSSPWVITLVPAGLTLLVIVFAFGAPLSFASSKITYALVTYAHDYWWLRFLIGGFFGLMIASDLGGIINKIGLISLIGLAQYDLRFASIISIGIPLASLGYGTSYALFKNKYKKEDSEDAGLSFRKGLNGMTEGPLFLTHKYGLRVILPNFLSTFIATGLSLVLGLYIFKGGHLGILFVGAQADLSHQNDIQFLNNLIPRGKGILTALYSLLYGIIGYYLIIFIGSISYAGISFITFSIPGKNKVFK